MKSVVMLVAVWIALVASSNAAVSVSVDRADGVYATGSMASFTISSSGLPAGGIDAGVSFLRDGLITTETTTVHLSGSPLVIQKTLYRPGQMMISVATSYGTAQVGAIFNPYQLQPGMGCPADFDEFWAAQKNKLAYDYTAEITPITPVISGTDLYHVKIPMPEGNPVQGYMCKPRGAAPRSLAAVAYTHGAGVRTSNKPGAWISGGSMGVIAFDFNAHGIDDGQPTSYYANLDTGALKYYRTEGWESRDTVYFRLMYLRALRAMDFLTRQPEWDGKTLAVYGSSQGGAQAIVCGALEPRVNVIVAAVPALCDLNAWTNKRVDGWPHIVKLGTDGKPLDPRISQTAPYYDMTNFARLILGDAFFTTGLIDATCPAVTVLPAYNLLRSQRKQIVIIPAGKHEYVAPYRRQGEDFIKQSAQNPRRLSVKLPPYE